MESPATFGELLTARRKKLGLSQSAAAREAGVSRLTWRAWENGTSQPYDYNYVRIEDAMGWAAGSVERAIAQQGAPIVVPRRIEVDNLRDANERQIWALGEEGGVSEERRWWHIDNYRERLAEGEKGAARRDRKDNSA